MSDLAAELDFALSLADAADAITLPHFEARTFTVDMKANHTEVTEVDKGTETALMDIIRAQRGHHAWYGEEHGSGGSELAEYTWVIDPIDGTSNYVRGVPVWATLIALVHREIGPVLGVVSAPALHTRWWGLLDGGAYCNGHPIQVSSVDDLQDTHLSMVDNSAWHTTGHTKALEKLSRTVKRERGFGDFWAHMLVAQGSVDIAVDAIGLEPYDIAAIIPIVQAAGGVHSDRFGKVDWRSNSAVSTNGLLHHTVINMLNS